MSSKVSALCIATLLLFFFTLSSAARPHPGSFSDDVEAEKVEEKCEGVGEDECLMRRTLAAHVDYIYTQKTQP
ncbi:hypothetical protein EZV62_011059 [Acer yangbiense]|uniref:Phytosulfokine n=1 Tax=Acer yangbiense TaxID=1000413 RepID=A0A5C7I4M4_9ROSI|nr:hypothetical protein EZV62_011059 [Acer yangbiense]